MVNCAVVRYHQTHAVCLGSRCCQALMPPAAASSVDGPLGLWFEAHLLWRMDCTHCCPKTPEKGF